MQSVCGFVKFEVFTAATMKNSVFWNVNRVALARTDDSEERIDSIIMVTRTDELETTIAVTNSRSTLQRNTSYC
jgi:hypothetical protein